MRELSVIELERIKCLTQYSIEMTLIEPTQTGLKKSIMDATGPIRTYFKEKNIHDYSKQGQGPSFKVSIASKIISYGSSNKSTASLYRPLTKNGDPRIWFSGLGNYASSGEILGIIAYDGQLFVINITQMDICKLLESKIITPLKELVIQIQAASNLVSDELLFKLKQIAKLGPIAASLNADTAIGRTLETLLGIDINSSKQPDYKGIELKSGRESKSNRVNLFAQVPNWSLSKFKSSGEILNNFGYYRGNELKLYCTVSTKLRNAQGLVLLFDNKSEMLFENSDKPHINDFVVWTLENLHKRLLEKHNETFWVSAKVSIIDNIEYFHYCKVKHTRKPIVSQFDFLLENGFITLDHLIKMTKTGKVAEKGPIFKIKPESVDLLFPPSETYLL